MKKRSLQKKPELDSLNNEQQMKVRGEFKAKKDLLTKDGRFKNISSTQTGQKIIFDEALRVVEKVVDWINNHSGKTYRTDLVKYFTDEDKVLLKITECYLYLAGTIYSTEIDDNRNKTRHKQVNGINEKILPELSFDNTWRFLEIIISYSQYFSSDLEVNLVKGSFQKSVKYSCSLSERVLEEVSSVAIRSFYPLPMEEKPVDWVFEDGEIKGGYSSYQFEMIRTTSKKLDYTKYSQEIFDSINYIQSTPWVVNEEVLNQILLDLRMPLKKDFVKTKFPNADLARWDLNFKDESLVIKPEHKKTILEAREKYKELSSLYNAELSDFESEVGKYRYVKLAAKFAKQYAGRTLYFPHSFDFRGRIYPLPIGLSPQGSDSIKAMLLYKNSETMTKRGLKWSWAYLASLYGDDKLDFEDRVIRGKELIEANYKEADEPYQFLSHQLELQKYLKNNNYKPSVRIHLDACNSG